MTRLKEALQVLEGLSVNSYIDPFGSFDFFIPLDRSVIYHATAYKYTTNFLSAYALLICVFASCYAPDLSIFQLVLNKF